MNGSDQRIDPTIAVVMPLAGTPGAVGSFFVGGTRGAARARGLATRPLCGRKW